MDGFTTCRRIREISRVPVVMVTGRKSAADRKQGKASGADGYVTKPFLAGKLVDLVAEFIADSAGYSDSAGEWNGEGSQPVHTPPGPQRAKAPAPSAAVLDSREPIGESGYLDQGKSSAASPQEELSAETAKKSRDDSGPSSPAFPAMSLAETANEDEDPVPADQPIVQPDDELYEGTVRLIITSSGPVKNLLAFVGELRQNTQLRLLRLVASRRSESMDIWLGLREPLHLIRVLGDIPGVSQVAALPDPGGDEEERRVTVAVGQ